MKNLAQALGVVTFAKIYDNSSVTEPFRLVATFENGKRAFVANTIPAWAERVVGPGRRKKRR